METARFLFTSMNWISVLSGIVFFATLIQDCSNRNRIFRISFISINLTTLIGLIIKVIYGKLIDISVIAGIIAAIMFMYLIHGYKKAGKSKNTVIALVLLTLAWSVYEHEFFMYTLWHLASFSTFHYIFTYVLVPITPVACCILLLICINRDKIAPIYFPLTNKLKENKYMNTFMDTLKHVTNITPIFEKLRSGRIILVVISVFYRVISVILGFALLVLWFMTWKLFKDANFFAGVALFIWQISFPYASFLVTKLLYTRAMEIKEYPESEYVIAPVMAMLTKITGEMAILFLGVMSIPSLFVTWFARDIMPIFSQLNEIIDNAFWGGIVAFLYCWILGFTVLLITQYIAEWTLAVFSIANNTSIIRKNTAP